MKNYLFVLTCVLMIATGLLIYKSCTSKGLQYDIPSLQQVVPKPKPTTHNNTTTTTTVVTKPNGETTTTTTIVDKTTVNPPRIYRLDLGAAMPLDRKNEKPIYDLSVSKQWMDHAWIGVAAYLQDSQLTHYGVRIGVEF